MIASRLAVIGLAAGVLAACQSGTTQVASSPSTIRFSPPECDYAVSFLERPEVGVSDDERRYLAVAAVGSANQRTVYYAECVNEPAIGATRAAELLVDLARSENLTNVQAFDVDTPVGPGYALTGSNAIANTPYEHRYTVVPGPMSAMVYGVAAPSAAAGGTDVEAYLSSIERQ